MALAHPSPATRAFLDDIAAMRRGDLHVGDDCAPLVRVLLAYQAEDDARKAALLLAEEAPEGEP